MKHGYLLLVVAALVLLLVEVGGWNVLAYSKFTRALTGADPTQQLLFILANPLLFVKIIAQDVWINTSAYMQGWVGVYGYNYWPVPALTYLLYPLAVVASLWTPAARVSRPSKRTRIVLAAFFVVGYLLSIISLYVAFTPVRSLLVAGVQGRYFTVVMPLLFLSILGIGPHIGRALRWLTAPSIPSPGLRRTSPARIPKPRTCIRDLGLRGRSPVRDRSHPLLSRTVWLGILHVVPLLSARIQELGPRVDFLAAHFRGALPHPGDGACLQWHDGAQRLGEFQRLGPGGHYARRTPRAHAGTGLDQRYLSQRRYPIRRLADARLSTRVVVTRSALSTEADRLRPRWHPARVLRETRVSGWPAVRKRGAARSGCALSVRLHRWPAGIAKSGQIDRRSQSRAPAGDYGWATCGAVCLSESSAAPLARCGLTE